MACRVFTRVFLWFDLVNYLLTPTWPSFESDRDLVKYIILSKFEVDQTKNMALFTSKCGRTTHEARQDGDWQGPVTIVHHDHFVLRWAKNIPAVVLPIMNGALGYSFFKVTNSRILVGLIQVQLLPLNLTLLSYSSVSWFRNKQNICKNVNAIQSGS